MSENPTDTVKKKTLTLKSTAVETIRQKTGRGRSHNVQVLRRGTKKEINISPSSSSLGVESVVPPAVRKRGVKDKLSPREESAGRKETTTSTSKEEESRVSMTRQEVEDKLKEVNKRIQGRRESAQEDVVDENEGLLVEESEETPGSPEGENRKVGEGEDYASIASNGVIIEGVTSTAKKVQRGVSKVGGRKDKEGVSDDDFVEGKKRTVSRSKKHTEQTHRRSGKLTLAKVLQQDTESTEERKVSLAAVKRKKEKEKQQSRVRLSHGDKVIREVVIGETMIVSQLANKMAEKVGDVLKKLMEQGIKASATQSIDGDTAELLVEEFGHKVRRVSDDDVGQHILEFDGEIEERKQVRPPVLTVMGHVDHGKTSLLDYLRNSNTVQSEAGGITQHIGAYQVSLANQGSATFIDTPGHEAFTNMRERGAAVTDIVILVVAADSGVQQQTKEAIAHSLAASVEIIVVFTKCDLPNTDIPKIKQQLLSENIILEEFGGSIACVEVSVKSGEGIDRLLEHIEILASIKEYKADPFAVGRAVVLEARLEQGRGKIMSLLMNSGTLSIGEVFVVGKSWGKVKTLTNEFGHRVKKALPGCPVEVAGIQDVPVAGDELIVIKSGEENVARSISEARIQKQRHKEQALARNTSFSLFSEEEESEVKELFTIIKADTQGNLEALVSLVEAFDYADVKVSTMLQGVGALNESDVNLLSAQKGGLIICYNVKVPINIKKLAKDKGVHIVHAAIIYKIGEEVEELLQSLTKPVLRRQVLGHAQIRQIFRISKVGTVAGCMVNDGIMQRNARVVVSRNEDVIHDGYIKQIRRFKKNIDSVQQGYECGISLKDYNKIEEGDSLECYTYVESNTDN